LRSFQAIHGKFARHLCPVFKLIEHAEPVLNFPGPSRFSVGPSVKCVPVAHFAQHIDAQAPHEHGKAPLYFDLKHVVFWTVHALDPGMEEGLEPAGSEVTLHPGLGMIRQTCSRPQVGQRQHDQHGQPPGLQPCPMRRRQQTTGASPRRSVSFMVASPGLTIASQPSHDGPLYNTLFKSTVQQSRLIASSTTSASSSGRKSRSAPQPPRLSHKNQSVAVGSGIPGRPTPGRPGT